jgi:uncharacterized protein involved in exopolysaccharide biosynthesis
VNTPSADRQRLNELNVKLLNLKHQYSEEYPEVIKTKAEVAELEQRVKASSKNAGKENPDNPASMILASQLSSAQSEIATANAQIRDLNTRLENYRHRIELSPQVESEYKVFLMERGNTQAKYDDLTKKYMESKVSQGLERENKGERFTIIDPAQLPNKPFKPNRPAIILIGLVLSISAGIGTASLRELIDTSVRTSDVLTRATSYPVLAVIPIINTKRESVPKKTLWIWAGIALALFAVCGVIFFHFFIMDLCVVWARLVG